jgi:hypothetical protein
MVLLARLDGIVTTFEILKIFWQFEHFCIVHTDRRRLTSIIPLQLVCYTGLVFLNTSSFRRDTVSMCCRDVLGVCKVRWVPDVQYDYGACRDQIFIATTSLILLTWVFL